MVNCNILKMTPSRGCCHSKSLIKHSKLVIPVFIISVGFASSTRTHEVRTKCACVIYTVLGVSCLVRCYRTYPAAFCNQKTFPLMYTTVSSIQPAISLKGQAAGS